MLSNIHTNLIRNLFIGGMIIAVLTGVLVTLLELKHIDRYVEGIAFEESSSISNHYIDFYRKRSDIQRADLEKAIQRSIDHELFIFIEFLDENMNSITKSSVSGFNRIESVLSKKFGTFDMSERFEYQVAYYNNNLYIKVMVHILDRDTDHVIGHFEGIYHLPGNKMAEIKKRGYYSIALSISVVIITTLLLYPIIYKLNSKLLIRSYDLLKSNTSILKSLGNAIAKRDSDTNEHNYRVTIFSVRLAEKIGIGAAQISSLIKGAFLHDIGKIGISDTILLKPGTLTGDEMESMKQHVAIGTEIVKNIEWLKDASDVIRFHHEKFDGTGYQSGLKGRGIPLNARIFSIVDVFDALTSKRPYKEPFSLEKSVQILKEGSGLHFDPDLLLHFIEIADILYEEIIRMEKENRLNICLDQILRRYFTVGI